MSLPFFPGVVCPASGQPHDLYVPRPDRMPYSARGRYALTCPATGRAVVAVPRVGHTVVGEPPPGAVPVARATGSFRRG